jgi:hypothetical protein
MLLDIKRTDLHSVGGKVVGTFFYIERCFWSFYPKMGTEKCFFRAPRCGKSSSSLLPSFLLIDEKYAG